MKRIRALHRRGTVAATAAGVATLLLGGGLTSLVWHGHATRPAAGPATPGHHRTSGAPVPTSTSADLGPVTDPAEVKDCLAPGFATDTADVAVVYGVTQKTPDGSSPVLVLRNATGQTRLCDLFGGDYPAMSPLPQADADHPVVFYSTGRRDWTCEQDTHALKRFTVTEWLSVADPVASVRLRFVVGGTPGDWVTTDARDGFVHLQAWLDGPVRHGTSLAMQQQVLDHQGNLVSHTVLPRTQRLPGCGPGSGSATIG